MKKLNDAVIDCIETARYWKQLYIDGEVTREKAFEYIHSNMERLERLETSYNVLWFEEIITEKKYFQAIDNINDAKFEMKQIRKWL